jgi:hypothetical protein
MSQQSKEILPNQSGNGPDESGFRSYLSALKSYQAKKNSGDDANSEIECAAGVSVELVEQEGVVKKLKIFCKCGELIEIDCDYGG